MLQDRINELNSGILDIEENKIYITGFMNEKMMQLHLNEDSNNWSSKGLYDNEKIDFYNIKDNAFFIVRENGTETNRYQYKSILKDTFQFKDENGKSFSLTINIRKSQYGSEYHLLTTKESLLFDSKNDLDNHLLKKYNVKYTY